MSFGRVEVYRGNSGFDNAARPRRKNLIRFLIFLFVFVACAAATLAYVFGRLPVYESVASVLITPPAAEETGTVNATAESGTGASDFGIIGIERYQLLAIPLLTRVLDLLRQEEGALRGLPANIAELRKVISIRRFETTKIVTLRAAGPDPRILPVIVNRWLDLYLETQARSQRSSASDENARLNRQVEALQLRTASKRAEIEAFRNRHDIVSMERDENRLLARLKGLTTSLNTTKEEELNAQGQLNAVTAALRSGKPVINLQNQRRMANLEQRLVALQEQIKDFEQRFTRLYMELDPNIKAVLRQRALVEERIAALRREASASVLAAAEQRLASTRQSVIGLKNEFERSKRRIAEFSARFAEHTALVEELAEMEATHRQARDRLLRREVNAEGGITKVEVLESAVLPIEPIWPNYTRDAGIGLGGSLVLGILAVLLFDFFTRPARSPESDLGAEIVRSALARTAPLPTLESSPVTQVEIEPDPPPAAVSYQPAARALDETEIGALMAAGDAETRLIIGLLLSGIALDQIAALRRGNFDIVAGVVTAPSQQPRAAAIPDALRAGFERQLSAAVGPDDPVWRDHEGGPRSREDLKALIMMTARDAGLAEPELATAEGILHSYLVYLVGQGMRLADLEIVTGPIAPSVRAAYAVHAPAGAAVPFDQVETVHPALRHALPD